MDNNMLKFIEIRNSYTIPKIGELSINEKALLECEKFCLELMSQVDKQKEVIDKAIEYIEKFIPIDEDTILMRERQRDYLLDILKGE